MFFWVITMRQQNLTFNVSSIRRHTKQSSKKGRRRRRSGSNGSQKGEVVSRRKKLKCALITKCSGVQGVVSASVELSSLTLDKQMQHKKSTTVDDHNMATGNLATWQGAA